MEKPLAVILGAGPGIGLAAARRFALEGFRVAVVPLPGVELDLPGALAAPAHLAQADQLREALGKIEAWGGFPQVLVYNASAGTRSMAAELPAAQALADLQVNVLSPLAGAQWALPSMRAQGRGTLLFTGGGLGLHPKAGLASGSLGKAAHRSLALSFAKELEPEGIHAATVTIRGFVQPDTDLSPERIAQCFWDLHVQPRGSWDKERVLP